MTKARSALTELEGAILGVLRRAPDTTPYAVRKVFLTSRSEEWSGSAGAVYPAIARLAQQRLIRAGKATDGRGSTAYRLSAAGLRAHDAWIADIERAAGIGIDPFRTRAGLWSFLPPRRRDAALRELERESCRLRDAVKAALPARDPADAAIDRLLIAQLDARLAWLKAVN